MIAGRLQRLAGDLLGVGADEHRVLRSGGALAVVLGGAAVLVALVLLRPVAVGPRIVAALAAAVLVIALLEVGVFVAAARLARRALGRRDALERDLERATRALERRVAERTAALTEANLRLRAEARERLHALEALRESELKHRLLLDGIDRPVLALRDDMTVHYCNAAFGEIVGMEPDTLVGSNLTGLFPSFGRSDAYAAYLRCIDSGEAQVVEGRFGERRFPARVRRAPWGLLAVAEDVEERRRAEEERVRFTRQLRVSAEMTRRLSAILEPEELMAETVELLCAGFDLYHALFYLVDDDGYLEARAGEGRAGDRLRAEGHRIELRAERSLVARAGRSGVVVHVDDVRDDPGFLPNPLLPDTHAEVAVPLVVGDKLLGVLDVQSDEPGRFTQLDVDTFSTLAGQIAVALENARLFDMHRRTEARLLETQHRLDVLFDRMPNVVMYETGGGREWVSDNVADLLGYPVERFAEDREFFPSLIHADDRDPVAEKVAEWRAAGSRGVVPLEFRCRRADGRYLWIQDFMVGIDPDSERRYLTGVLIDISERKQAEHERLHFTNQLRLAAEAAQRLSAILEPDRLMAQTVGLLRDRFGLYCAMIYMLDDDGRRLVARAGSGLEGQRLLEGRHAIPIDGNGGASLVGHAARTQSVARLAEVAPDDEGTPRSGLPATQSELALPLVAHERLIGVLDVHDTRSNRFTPADVDTFSLLAGQIAISLENARLFAESRRTADRLREVDRLKSEFLTNMSHELRTPLNSIVGYAELMLMGVDGQLDGEMGQDVRAIFDNGQHLLGLINDLLDLAKIEAGRMRLEVDQVDVGPLLEVARTNNAGLLVGKPIELRVEAAPDLPTIEGDRVRLVQILNNLVSNAAKFTKAGHIRLSAYRDDDAVCIEVADTGVGIEAPHLRTIFQKFRQLDGSLTRRAQGTGLGLAITHHLVEMHGGRIDVDSEVGVGTTFTVRLPVARRPRPEAPPEPAALLPA